MRENRTYGLMRGYVRENTVPDGSTLLESVPYKMRFGHRLHEIYPISGN
jgi:hypothetical protein